MLCDDGDGWDGKWEGGSRGRDVFMHITDPLRYVAETNITL